MGSQKIALDSLGDDIKEFSKRGQFENVVWQCKLLASQYRKLARSLARLAVNVGASIGNLKMGYHDHLTDERSQSLVPKASHQNASDTCDVFLIDVRSGFKRMHTCIEESEELSESCLIIARRIGQTVHERQIEAQNIGKRWPKIHQWPMYKIRSWFKGGSKRVKPSFDLFKRLEENLACAKYSWKRLERMTKDMSTLLITLEMLRNKMINNRRRQWIASLKDLMEVNVQDVLA